MHAYTPAQWKGFLTMFCGASLLAAAAVAGFNYAVDPYLIHQWDTPQVQRLRPTREKLAAWGKTYALARLRPAVVYVGNSRTELGLPTSTPYFAGQAVFNAALSGASLGDTLAMARHASAVSRVKLLVWGIDPPSFSMEAGNTDFDRELVAGGPLYLYRRLFLNLKRALSLDMTADSLRLLRGSFGRRCHSSLAFNGLRDEACIHDRIEGWGGTRAAVQPRTREYIRGAGPTPQAQAALEERIAALCAAGTAVRLYINPTHAMMMDALYWAGKWEPLLAWQSRLADFAAAYRTRACDVRVYDFSGFNSVTTEAVPQASRRNHMDHYWETSHYRVGVGRMILGRMFGPDSAAPAGFGSELLPSSMAAHHAALLAGRERYHAEHPVETAMARTIAAEQLMLRPAGHPAASR